jgi:uncharacterized OB-fold protein
MSAEEIPRRPVPAPDELTLPYWEASNRGELAIQRCGGCKTYQHPALAVCFSCGSDQLAYERVSGRGTIYSYTITYDARTPAFTARQPYALVWVELVEQPRLRILANMPETPLGDVRIGASVEAYFEELAPGVRVPQFRLAGEG